MSLTKGTKTTMNDRPTEIKRHFYAYIQVFRLPEWKEYMYEYGYDRCMQAFDDTFERFVLDVDSYSPPAWMYEPFFELFKILVKGEQPDEQ